MRHAKQLLPYARRRLRHAWGHLMGLSDRVLVAGLALNRARSCPRAGQRKGVGGARTLNGESACAATLPSISKKPDAGCGMPGDTSGVCPTVCL